MSEAGKEVKGSVYSKPKKTVSSGEEAVWRHQHACTPTGYHLPSEPSCSQTNRSLQPVIYTEDQTSGFCHLPFTEVHKVRDTGLQFQHQYSLTFAFLSSASLVSQSLSLGSCMVCQVLSAFLYARKTE